MAVNVNAMRNNNSFNEKLRARIFSNSSYASTSGSEHDSDSVVLNFLEDDSTEFTQSRDRSDSSDSDDDFGSEKHRSKPTFTSRSVLDDLTARNNADLFRNQLLVTATRSAEMFTTFRKNRSVFNRNLTSYLREIGYNAGVCKTRWDSAGGLTAGNYEFIDVISSGNVRYIIDSNFSGEFEIARESESYAGLRRSLPRVLVAKPDDLKKIVRLMCDEARQSMKINGLSLPPWRKNRYMLAKWLGSYRRSSNPFPVMTSSPVESFGVKCRSVGFDVGGDCGHVFVPPVTKTR